MKTGRNLIVVFLLCGLWHGAAWTFVLWGAWHGMFLVIERITGTRGVVTSDSVGLSAGDSSRIGRGAMARAGAGFVRHAYVLVVVLCGWVLFRSDTLPQAASYLGAMLGWGAATVNVSPLDLVDGVTALVLVAALLGSVPWAPKLGRWIAKAREDRPNAAREVAVAIADNLAIVVVLLLSIASLAAGTHNPFIYFRF